MKYRSSMQITSTILQATQDVGRDGITITPLISKSNLQHTRLSKIMGKLTSSGLVNKIEQRGKNTYVITEAGILYLEEYKKFASFADSFGLEL